MVQYSTNILFFWQEADVYRKAWYANTCDRKNSHEILNRTNKVSLHGHLMSIMLHIISHPIHLNCENNRALFQDGAFMVRKSSGQDTQQPYTLAVFYKGRVYNIPIRFIPANKQYALGSEKKGEEVPVSLLSVTWIC